MAVVRSREDSSGYVSEERTHVDSTEADAFDRIAYTMEALRALALPRLHVAVHETHRALSVSRGRMWGTPHDEWVILGVPPDASREHIATAVAGIAGIRSESLAYAVFRAHLDQSQAYALALAGRH